MPVPPTTYLKIARVQSEHDQGKVATLNTGDADFDTGLGGFASISVAGSANVTLTRAQALNPSIKLTGLLTGNITIFIPVIENLAITPPTTTIGALRKYMIWNATTGAFTVTIKTSAVGSAGVTITQTKKVYVEHDNTDVYKTTTEV